MTVFSMIHHESMVTTVTVAQDPSASLQPERPYAFHPYCAWAMWPPPRSDICWLKKHENYSYKHYKP